MASIEFVTLEAFVIRDSGTIVSKTRDAVDRPRQASRKAGGSEPPTTSGEP
jgi:hypothetical protein